MPTSLRSAFRRMLLGSGVLLAASVVATPAQAQARSPYHQAPKDTVSQQVYNGWKQYELNCARCHGEYAMGSSFAPNLTVSLKDGGTIPSKESFMQVVCAGRAEKGMPGWCALGMEMQTIEGIYTYVRGRAIGAVGPGRPAVDEKLPPGVPEPKKTAQKQG